MLDIKSSSIYTIFLGVFSAGFVIGYYSGINHKKYKPVNSKLLNDRVNMLLAAKMGLIDP